MTADVIDNLQSRLLKRQIKKHLKHMTEENTANALQFFESIDSEYKRATENRELLEGTIDLNDKELQEKNKKLSGILEKNIKINQELEEGKKHLSMIIDNVGEGLIVIGGKGKILEANTKALKLSGFEREHLIGAEYNEKIIFSNDNPHIEIDDFIKQTLEDEQERSFTRDINLVGKNTTLPIFVTSSPVKNYRGEETACVVVFRDATKERELDALKSEFLSVASHELRTPMTVIKGYVSLFMRGKLGDITEKQTTYLQKIYDNTSGLIDMVNDMLDVNKLEAGKMDFSYEPFNLSELLNKILTEMHDLMEKKQISLTGDFVDLMVCSDVRKLEQVIINFISNAYKFSKEGGKIIVSVTQDESKKKFCVAVEDFGIGIEKENIGKLFKKFSQVGSHLNKTIKGTGLGLSICKEIAEGMGGKVGVKSVYGKGSIFFVMLPCGKLQELEDVL